MKTKKYALFSIAILAALLTFFVSLTSIKEIVSWSKFYDDTDEFFAKQTIFYIVNKQNEFLRHSQEKKYDTFSELCPAHKDFDKNLCENNPVYHGFDLI